MIGCFIRPIGKLNKIYAIINDAIGFLSSLVTSVMLRKWNNTITVYYFYISLFNRLTINISVYNKNILH